MMIYFNNEIIQIKGIPSLVQVDNSGKYTLHYPLILGDRFKLVSGVTLYGIVLYEDRTYLYYFTPYYESNV